MKRTVLVAYVLGLTGLLLFPSPPTGPGVVSGADKLFHAAAFLGLTVLGIWNYPSRARAVVTLVLSYSVLTEVAQIGLPTRVFEVWDLIADTLGVLAGLVMTSGVRRVRHPRV